MPRKIFICGQIDKLILEVSEFEKNEEMLWKMNVIVIF